MGLAVVERACISRGRAPGIHEYRSICTPVRRCVRGAQTLPRCRSCAPRCTRACSSWPTRRWSGGAVCRCLVTRQQSPWGLNTVCTSVVRELDPMWARTNYQLIFHERALGYVTRLPNTLRNLWKLVIQPRAPLRAAPCRRGARRFISREKTGRMSERFSMPCLFFRTVFCSC